MTSDSDLDAAVVVAAVVAAAVVVAIVPAVDDRLLLFLRDSSQNDHR